MSLSYSVLVATAFSKIVGFEVMPLSPSSWISRASSPERTRSRVMKSYQGLWPRRLSATSGFAVADGLSLMHRSR